MRYLRRTTDKTNGCMIDMDDEFQALINLWVLKMLVPLGGIKEFVNDAGFSDDDLAEYLGLEKWIDSQSVEFNAKEVRIEIRGLYTQAAKHVNGVKPTGLLDKNIGKLSDLLKLTPVESMVLAFLTCMDNIPILVTAALTMGAINTRKLYRCMSVILGLNENDVKAALSESSVLFSSRIVGLRAQKNDDLEDKIYFNQEGFAEQLFSNDVNPIDLLKQSVIKGRPSDLSLTDFEPIKSRYEILIPHLASAISKKKQGVNIFVYGPPGTGKTQFARVIGQHLGAEYFEVVSQDQDGQPTTGEERLSALSSAQLFLRNREPLLIFDEAEDIFNNGSVFAPSTAQSHKAWINSLLEENLAPVIWLSNSSDLDKAFIRRFDMVFELPVPARPQREAMIRAVLPSKADDRFIKRLAGVKDLSPAVVSRAVNVASQAAAGDEIAVQSRIECLIDDTLCAQGHQGIQQSKAGVLPDVYDTSYVNTCHDLNLLKEGLINTRAGRLCLYGPPGTGKTAYGQWLAEQLDMPLLIKRGSDLLSKWVGGTEANIADAFKEASDDGALLLIDEVDSFLQDRRQANTNWEVTGVNEMLTQLERYEGVFIASTNLVQGLDQAALRRFDLKLKFDFLTEHQAWALLEDYCQQLKLGPPDTRAMSQLADMSYLTPGDFAAVVRRHKFSPILKAADMVKALADDCALKEGAKRSIGFM